MTGSLIRRFHPEGIPWPGSLLYNFISRSCIFKEHYELVAAEIMQYCKGGRILDAGTGPGWLLHAIRRIDSMVELHGADISDAMVRKAVTNAAHAGLDGIGICRAGVTRLPFADEYFDCVVSTGSIHHWKDVHSGLTEIYRVLKKDSYALIYDLVRRVPPDVCKAMKRKYGRFRMGLFCLHSLEEPFYSAEELKKMADGTPFKNIAVHYTGGLCCLVLKKQAG